MLESHGPRVDAEAFARLDPDDVALVREALGEIGLEEVDQRAYGVEGFGDEEPGTEEEAEEQDEIARLQGVIELSRMTQRALERYVAALDGPALG